ncbi:hypothetical protein C6N75_27905, partial [Streptomyces solincola]
MDHWPPARPEDGEPTAVRALAADSAGGPLAVAATERGAVRVWDTATGEPVGRPCADDGGAGQVALTRLAGRPIAVTAGGDEGAVRLFDVLTGRPLGDPLTDTGPSAALAVAAARSPLLVAGLGEDDALGGRGAQVPDPGGAVQAAGHEQGGPRGGDR